MDLFSLLLLILLLFRLWTVSQELLGSKNQLLLWRYESLETLPAENRLIWFYDF